ncbi:MAG: hypothetical protein JO030_03920 [Candidatus Eremiobacteraeota bacterium]|nr:hypothetical protein [Candidatus Eremiobacteraeota bacterium]
MSLTRDGRLRRLLLAAVLSLAACAQHAPTLPSVVQAPQFGASVTPDRSVPECKGQKTTKKYSELTAKLSSKGGHLCVPAYGGWGGTLQYPGANPPVNLTLISSTKNYNHQPHLGKGTAIFYLQIEISGGTSFGSKVRAGGGLTSKKVIPGKPYTAYGQATIFSFTINFGPCYAVAKKGPYGGVIGGVGSLLKGQSVPAQANGVIEIYAGKQTGTTC